MTKPMHLRRQPITARLPLALIAALNRAVDENGTTLTEEVEARLTETLIADGLITVEAAIATGGACSVVAASLNRAARAEKQEG